MNEIKGFEGNPMTGWTVRLADGTIKTAFFSRFAHSQTVTLYYDELMSRYVIADSLETVAHRDTLEEALEDADTLVKQYGGWCASPCGIDDFALKTLEAENAELTKENNLQRQSLINMSRDNADLEAERLRLKKFEPKVTLFDCTQGRHEWERVPKTDQMHKCRRCGMVSGK